MSKYVDVSKHSFVVEPRYYFYGWSTCRRILGRESAVLALEDARRRLPPGMNFKIWDMKRDRPTQRLMRRSFRKRLGLLHPTLSRAAIEDLVTCFGAKLPKRTSRQNTHIAGGAVDLTIVDAEGCELHMGTDHDDLTERAALDYYECRSRLSICEKEARRNRGLLKSVMLASGFKPYSREWWHWSFDE